MSGSKTPSTAPKKPDNDTTSKIPKKRSLLAEFTLAGATAATCCLFTNPLEVVKTIMQAQGELGAEKAYKNSFECARKVIQTSGIRGIQSGLAPAILYQIMMNGVRLGAYEPIKNLFGLTHQSKHSTTYFLSTIAAGASSGILGAIVGSPFFLVKVRMQTQASSAVKAVGTQHHYKGTMYAFKEIYMKYGIHGYFQGVTAGISRVAVGSAAQLSTYDNIKKYCNSFEYLRHHEFINRCVSAFMATFTVVTAMNGLDVVATRMYNQLPGEKYKGVADCLVKIVKNEGVKGLFKGWFPHYFRLGPHTILTFLIWEQYKIVASRYGF